MSTGVALLTAAHERVSAVVAFAPSPVVWGAVRPDGSVTSHWTRDGAPLPYVPFVEPSRPAGTPPAFRRTYAESLASAPPDTLAAAMIPVERTRAEVILVAGGDDQRCVRTMAPECAHDVRPCLCAKASVGFHASAAGDGGAGVDDRLTGQHRAVA